MAKAAGIHAPDVILAEICSYASKATGEKIVPHIAPNYRDLSHRLDRGSLGLAWLPPILTIECDENGVAVPLVLPARKGMASYYAAFITRKGGPKTLADCKRRSVVWVDRESASGYVIPRLHLSALGYDVGSFFSSETFVGDHLAVVNTVLAGKADFGVTFCNMEAGTKKIVTGGWTEADGRSDKPIHVIDVAGPIPNDAIVASTRLSPALRASLARWLLGVTPPERELFQRLFRATGFRVIPDGHFEPLRHMVRKARVRGFSLPPPA